MSSRVNARPGGLIPPRCATPTKEKRHTGFPHDTFEKNVTILKRENIAHTVFLKNGKPFISPLCFRFQYSSISEFSFRLYAPTTR